MRSTFFQQPLQHQIEIDGENWDQGGKIKGKLIISNISSETIVVNASQVILAYGLKKSIKEGNGSRWEVLEKLVLTKNLSLSAGGQQSYEWIFNWQQTVQLQINMGDCICFLEEKILFLKEADLTCQLACIQSCRIFCRHSPRNFFSWKNI